MTPPIAEVESTMTPVPLSRPELEARFGSIDRELSGLGSKLDVILQQKTDEARVMGGLQQQVRSLEDNFREQAKSIHALEASNVRNQVAPRDALIRGLLEMLKWGAGAAVGYFLSGGKIHT